MSLSMISLSTDTGGGDVELSVWRVRRERTIMDTDIFAKTILVGPKGDGKAEVANMLIQGKLFLRNRVMEDLKEEEQPTQVEHASLEVVDGRGWLVCLVDGIQELDGGVSEQVTLVKQGLSNAMKEVGGGGGGVGAETTSSSSSSSWGFNMFCLVLRCDHVFNADSERYLASFRRLFSNNPTTSSRLVLIITGSSEKWVKDNWDRLHSEFSEFFITPVQFLFDENMPNMFLAQRDEALKTLENSLSPLCDEVVVPDFLK